jgi:hypothetical protein
MAQWRNIWREELYVTGSARRKDNERNVAQQQQCIEGLSRRLWNCMKGGGGAFSQRQQPNIMYAAAA